MDWLSEWWMIHIHTARIKWWRNTQKESGGGEGWLDLWGLHAGCGVCACVCAHVLLCMNMCACAWKKKKCRCRVYRLWRLSALRSGCVRTPHLPSQDAADCVCMYLLVCVRVCSRVCVDTIWAEHQGHAWTARWASPLLICPAPSPHQGRSTPRQGQHCHPRNTNSGGRHWLSIIDGSWL